MSYKLSECLALTRARVWDGVDLRGFNDPWADPRVPQTGTQYKHICTAAAKALESHDAQRVMDVVHKLMSPEGHRIGLQDWLFRTHRIYVDPNDRDQVQKLQTTRLAWLDHLIAHYTSLGD